MPQSDQQWMWVALRGHVKQVMEGISKARPLSYAHILPALDLSPLSTESHKLGPQGPCKEPVHFVWFIPFKNLKVDDRHFNSGGLILFLDQLLCGDQKLIASMAMACGSGMCCPSLEWQACAKWPLLSALPTWHSQCLSLKHLFPYMKHPHLWPQ